MTTINLRHVLGALAAASLSLRGSLALVLPSNSLRSVTIESSSALHSAVGDPEISLNPIVASVKVSKTVEIFSLVKQMEADGESVTSLCVGEPDFLPPQAVLDAAMAAINDGDTRYTAVTGTAPLREAIAADLKRRKGLEYNPQTEIIVGNGAKRHRRRSVIGHVERRS